MSNIFPSDGVWKPDYIGGGIIFLMCVAVLTAPMWIIAIVYNLTA